MTSSKAEGALPFMQTFGQYHRPRNALAQQVREDVYTYIFFIIVCDTSWLVGVGMVLLH